MALATSGRDRRTLAARRPHAPPPDRPARPAHPRIPTSSGSRSSPQTQSRRRSQRRRSSSPARAVPQRKPTRAAAGRDRRRAGPYDPCGRPRMTHDPTFWLLARASGLTAYALLTATVLAGLVLKSRPFGRAVKRGGSHRRAPLPDLSRARNARAARRRADARPDRAHAARRARRTRHLAVSAPRRLVRRPRLRARRARRSLVLRPSPHRLPRLAAPPLGDVFPLRRSQPPTASRPAPTRRGRGHSVSISGRWAPSPSQPRGVRSPAPTAPPPHPCVKGASDGQDRDRPFPLQRVRRLRRPCA